MRVRISYTVDVDDDHRRAINHYHGEPGLAKRADIKDFYMLHGSQMDDDIVNDMDDEEDG